MDGSTSSELTVHAADISRGRISDEKIRLQGEIASLKVERGALRSALQQIAEHANEAAQRGEPIAAGFALGRIIELCAACADEDDDESGVDDPIY